ncbi:MAG: hypothetical protein WBG11_08195 [Methylocella sp.]
MVVEYRFGEIDGAKGMNFSAETESGRVLIVTDKVLLSNISVPVPRGEYDAHIDWRIGEDCERRMRGVQLVIDKDTLARMGYPAGIPSMHQEVLRYLIGGDIERA